MKGFSMLDWFLELLKNPEFLIFVATYAGTKLLDSAGSRIKQLKDLSKKGTPEWQFLTCLERAFFTTETQLGWEHKTEAIYESFEDALLSHQGFFTISSLKEIFEAAVERPVTEADLAAWVTNFKRELAMGDYPALLRFLSIDHMLQPQASAQANQPNYILTSSASIYDNPVIICRDEFIDDLLQLISSGHKQIQITGMGGLGKTETLTKLFAKLAADKQYSSFDHIAFIRFSGDIMSDIESQLDYPRQYLGLQGIEAAKRFLHDICAEKNVLLCIDDIRANQEIVKQDNPTIQYFRSLGASIVLAARAGFPDFERNDLSFLSTNACIELFEKKFGKTVSDINDVEILINIIENRAGNHTLIINRLGNIAKDYGWSISVLAERLKEKDFNFHKGIADEELLQQEINKLYQVDELPAAEKNILEAFSIFPSAPLDVDLCVKWLHEDAGVDEDSCLLLLNMLAERTWLEKRLSAANTVTFAMHQLAKIAVQEQSTIAYENHHTLVDECSASINLSNVVYRMLNSSILLSSTISVFRNLFQESVPFANLSDAIAIFYYESGQYNSALEWYLKALEIRKKISGEDHPDTATSYNNIATIYQSLGQNEHALKWHLEALEIRERVLGKEHLHTANSYNNIAQIYADQWEFDLAMEWHLKALAINEKVLNWDHPRIATSYNNIGGVYYRQAKYDLAIEWYLKALAIVKKVLGEFHPYTATTYNNIGCVYNDQGDYDLALDYYQKDLKIIEYVLGKDHPDTASAYNNIAGIYKKKKQYDLALEWYHKAIETRRKVLGNDHPDIAASCHEIADLFENTGQNNNAVEWYQKALAIRERALEKDHPLTAITYNNIAAACYSLGETNQALEYFKKAHGVFTVRLGPEHLYTINTKKAVSALEELILKPSH